MKDSDEDFLGACIDAIYRDLDGARVCMAGEASSRAIEQNVEGMWTGKTSKQQRAVVALVGSLKDQK